MRSFLLTIAALLLSASSALAQGVLPNPLGNASNMTVTATGSTTANTTADRASWLQDVRNWGPASDCATNVNTEVAAMVAAGVLRIFIPAACKYIPAGNAVPAGITIIGEDWKSSVISSDVPSTNGLTIGAHTLLQNIGINAQFCYNSTSPVGAKVCPTGRIENISDSSYNLFNWAYEDTYILGPTSTAPGAGSASTDIPGIAIIELSTGGDGLFVQTGSPTGPVNAVGASGIRIITDGDGDQGIYILNGSSSVPSSRKHNGIFVKEFAVGDGQEASIKIDRAGDGTNVQRSVQVTDVDSTGNTNTSSLVELDVSHQSSGSLINLFQGTTALNGTVLFANMGNSSGTFTGNFINFQIAGSTVFNVGVAGNAVAQSYVQAMAGVVAGAPTGGAKTNGVNVAGVYWANGTTGVSCTANSVVLSTFVVTAGIVTHC